MLSEELRPQNFGEVVGNAGVIETLKSLSQDRFERFSGATLFVGPTGIGKTSMVRICSALLVDTNPVKEPDGSYSPNPQSPNVAQILRGGWNFHCDTFDGATMVSADLRLLGGLLQFSPIVKPRIVFIDEVQELSKPELAILRGMIERNHRSTYLFFACSDRTKLDRAFSTRPRVFELRPPTGDEIAAHLRRLLSSGRVLTREGEPFPAIFMDEGIATIAELAQGSVREANQLLQRCRDSALYSRDAIERALK
jgi:DNA polymerase III gamma/tau subunit